MSSNLEKIFQAYQNNYAFREAFKSNPENALKLFGLECSPEDLLKIRAMTKLDPSKNEKFDGRRNQ